MNVDEDDVELYYRASDQTEPVNLAADPTAEQRRVIERFESVIHNHVNTLRNQNERTVDETVDDDLERQLEALGYR